MQCRPVLEHLLDLVWKPLLHERWLPDHSETFLGISELPRAEDDVENEMLPDRAPNPLANTRFQNERQQANASESSSLYRTLFRSLAFVGCLGSFVVPPLERFLFCSDKWSVCRLTHFKLLALLRRFSFFLFSLFPGELLFSNLSERYNSALLLLLHSFNSVPT